MQFVFLNDPSHVFNEPRALRDSGAIFQAEIDSTPPGLLSSQAAAQRA